MEVSSGVENPNPTTYEEMGLATLSYVGDEKVQPRRIRPIGLGAGGLPVQILQSNFLEACKSGRAREQRPPWNERRLPAPAKDPRKPTRQQSPASDLNGDLQRAARVRDARDEPISFEQDKADDREGGRVGATLSVKTVSLL